MQNPVGAFEAYFNMQGLLWDGSPNVNPVTGQTTKYVVDGDPVSETGWIASSITPEGNDISLETSTGPFDLSPGESQEVVFAIVIGQGADHLASIEVMKYFARQVRAFYQNNFALLIPMSPAVSATAVQDRIVLTWDNRANAFNQKGYRFEGYNVYQGETPNGPWHWLITYDLINRVGLIYDVVYDSTTGLIQRSKIANGSDTGLQYYFATRQDYQGRPLLLGKDYYFAITTYAVTRDNQIYPRVIESEKCPVKVVVQDPPFGANYGVTSGDTLTANHFAGNSLGWVHGIVVDPTQLTGHTYRVSFTANNEIIFWQIDDVTSGTTLLANQTDQSGHQSLPFIDGILFQIYNNAYNPNTIDDVFELTVPALQATHEQALADFNRINVFPNPYFGMSSLETGATEQWVIFTHLPAEYVIRIFTLAGEPVRTLLPEGTTTLARWDLCNDAGARVTSGIYLIWIEVPGIGNRVLKLAVLQRHE